MFLVILMAMQTSLGFTCETHRARKVESNYVPMAYLSLLVWTEWHTVYFRQMPVGSTWFYQKRWIITVSGGWVNCFLFVFNIIAPKVHFHRDWLLEEPLTPGSTVYLNINSNHSPVHIPFDILYILAKSKKVVYLFINILSHFLSCNIQY